jgi:hypothetical protein
MRLFDTAPEVFAARRRATGSRQLSKDGTAEAGAHQATSLWDLRNNPNLIYLLQALAIVLIKVQNFAEESKENEERKEEGQEGKAQG